VNALDQDEFVAALGPLFEHSPWIAAATWPARPFASLDQLHQALCATMYAAPVERQVALIQAHPDLAGKAAIAGALTAASAREQSSAGLGQLSPEEFAAFTRLNGAYRETFGFPFVICAREHTKTSILEQFAVRLEHSREQEIRAALGEIAKIARLRLLDAVRE
jgi:OHCU decarboxylase